MPDLRDGDSTEMQGSGSRPYVLKNVGGVYSCSCPAWRNQSLPIERRTCKHLRRLRGDAAETDRVGGALSVSARAVTSRAVTFRAVTGGAAGDRIKPTPPALLLAETWDSSLNPTDWWMSEKLDGVRAYWDGTQFLSRLGNRYHAPDWFTARFPKVPLDGELWIDRQQFQRTVSIVRRHDQTALWREVRFLIFDAPAVPGPVEQRFAYAEQIVQDASTQVLLFHPQVRCRSMADLQEELRRITSQGGEGVMLRQPGTAYVAGRSLTLLKVKTFRDGEALVVDYQPGTGRHKDRLGALLVQLPNGTTFAVGSGLTDSQRENPPAKGSVITFKYQELSNAGVPRFATYLGVRPEADSFTTSCFSTREPGARHMAATNTKRRFELVQGNSDKFWEIEIEGTAVTVRFGRNGTRGQASLKKFQDPVIAERHTAKAILEKLAKGYVEVAVG